MTMGRRQTADGSHILDFFSPSIIYIYIYTDGGSIEGLLGGAQNVWEHYDYYYDYYDDVVSTRTP